MVYLATLVLLIAVGHHVPAEGYGFDYVPGEILVKYKSSISAASISERHAQKGIKTKRAFRQMRVHHVELPAGLGVEKALEMLRSESSVDYAEPNYFRYTTKTTPDDPEFGLLWGLDNSGQIVNGTSGTKDADINAPEAWDSATDCDGIVIAVIDSGIDYDHPDLRDNMWSNADELAGGDGVDDDGNGYVDDVRGWDFVDNDNDPMDINGHGTHVAGTIGAKGDNGRGITGVCWSAQVIPLRFIDDSGLGTVADEISAIQYAIIKGAKIINASFSGNASMAEQDAISHAKDAGILFVAATGNEGDNTPSYPAGYDLVNIISVAATNQNDGLADFSNYGAAWVDVGAPGVNIYSTLPGGTYDYKDGTSMATPHVVGLAGLIRNTDPSLTHAEVRYIILNSVVRQASLVGKTVTGGRINAFNALDALSSPLPLLPPSEISATSVSTNQVDLSWDDDSSIESGFKIERRLSGGLYAQIDTVSANTTTYIDQSGNEGTSYTYRVRAYNDTDDSDYSNEANATTFPASPSGLSASAVSSNQVNLSWEDNSFGESGFKIERKTGSGGTYTQIATVDADVLSYSNIGLTGSTTYYYRVRAYNSGGDSTYSNEENATTAAPPPAGSSGGGRCFIVTAADGLPMELLVNVLSAFRD
jgi:hypothetical protein